MFLTSPPTCHHPSNVGGEVICCLVSHKQVKCCSPSAAAAQRGSTEMSSAHEAPAARPRCTSHDKLRNAVSSQRGRKKSWTVYLLTFDINLGGNHAAAKPTENIETLFVFLKKKIILQSDLCYSLSMKTVLFVLLLKYRRNISVSGSRPQRQREG